MSPVNDRQGDQVHTQAEVADVNLAHILVSIDHKKLSDYLLDDQSLLAVYVSSRVVFENKEVRQPKVSIADGSA